MTDRAVRRLARRLEPENIQALFGTILPCFPFFRPIIHILQKPAMTNGWLARLFVMGHLDIDSSLGFRH